MSRPRNDRSERWALKISERRAFRGWTQPQLAQRLGWSVRRIQRIENDHIVPPDADRARLDEEVKISEEASASLRGVSRKVSGAHALPPDADDIVDTGEAVPVGPVSPLQRLRYVGSDMKLFRTIRDGRVAADMLVTLHNPNDFDLKFKATLRGEINGKAGSDGQIQLNGYISPHADVILQYDRIADFPMSQTAEPSILGILKYEIMYKHAFQPSIEAKSGAELRMISWEWPFRDHEADFTYDRSVLIDNEIEE